MKSLPPIDVSWLFSSMNQMGMSYNADSKLIGALAWTAKTFNVSLITSQQKPKYKVI
jgi:hypothetical protein